jgi:hypothetical protein
MPTTIFLLEQALIFLPYLLPSTLISEKLPAHSPKVVDRALYS